MRPKFLFQVPLEPKSVPYKLSLINHNACNLKVTHTQCSHSVCKLAYERGLSVGDGSHSLMAVVIVMMMMVGEVVRRFGRYHQDVRVRGPIAHFDSIRTHFTLAICSTVFYASSGFSWSLRPPSSSSSSRPSACGDGDDAPRKVEQGLLR